MMPEPARAEDVDHSEQALDLAIGERGGRLVHDHDLGVDADRLGDLHELLLGHAQRFDETLRVDRGSDTRQELGGLTTACVPVDRPPRATTLEREGDVLSDGEVRKQRRLLIDRRDPELPGGGGIHVGDGSSGNQQRSGIRRLGASDDFDEGRLARPVFSRRGHALRPVAGRRRRRAAPARRQRTS